MKSWMKSRVGEIQEITMMDLRQCPGLVFDAVETGLSFVLTKNGKQIAVIRRPEDSGLTLHVLANGKVTYVTPTRSGR